MGAWERGENASCVKKGCILTIQGLQEAARSELSAMTPAQLFATILTNPPIGNIDFMFTDIHISPDQFGKVVTALKSGKITVAESTKTDGADARSPAWSMSVIAYLRHLSVLWAQSKIGDFASRDVIFITDSRFGQEIVCH